MKLLPISPGFIVIDVPVASRMSKSGISIIVLKRPNHSMRFKRTWGWRNIIAEGQATFKFVKVWVGLR
jgi:hypothetical protein